jgi:biopolymer transport protein ExbD
MKSEIFTSQIKYNLNSGTPEVGMAPLIDVVFLLLIFFMVTTVFPDNRGFVIEKPQSEQSDQLEPKKLTFAIDQSGTVHFQDNTISTDDISRLVEEQLHASPDAAVMLQVDRRASTEMLIEVMDACKSGGANRVAIATKPNENT